VPIYRVFLDYIKTNTIIYDVNTGDRTKAEELVRERAIDDAIENDVDDAILDNISIESLNIDEYYCIDIEKDEVIQV